MSKQMKFTVGGFFDGYKTIELRIDGDKATYKILRNGLLDMPKKISPAAKVSEAWLKELDALKIFSWEESYFDENILDGTQWTLIFKDGRKKIYRGGGSNAYPENWERFLDWLDALIPELEFIDRKRLERVTLNYFREESFFETLILDRRERTLTLEKKKSTHIYDTGDDTKKIFDACQKFFDGLETEDADFDFASRVKFDLLRHDGSTKIFETPYNENFLPGLKTFLEEIHGITSDLTAEIFSPPSAEAAPRQGKYIFCKVQFKGSYKSYTYSTDDETLAVGDVVDVPVGRFNDVAQAKIIDIGYFDEYETPFPIERIKKIIGKHVADDWENY